MSIYMTYIDIYIRMFDPVILLLGLAWPGCRPGSYDDDEPREKGRRESRSYVHQRISRRSRQLRVSYRSLSLSLSFQRFLFVFTSHKLIARSFDPLSTLLLRTHIIREPYIRRNLQLHCFSCSKCLHSDKKLSLIFLIELANNQIYGIQ